ncbi:MAG TPA: GntR family transcriptional regulator [Kiloniellales bacterium]|jgi:DNA-binding GntR family transcriptional regulator
MNDIADAGVAKPQPIARASLHDELVARLRDLIVEGELTPGMRVPERALCERFGVSRTPLREALKVLASEGFLHLLPNRGATVTSLTVADMDEVFPVMGALEALAGELACTRITDEQIAEIRALHYQMVLHYTRKELPQYFRLNQRIHELIMDAAGNATLSRLYRGLAGRIRRARYVANMTKVRWDNAVEEHEAILLALSQRDAARLGRILKQHLRNKCETVKESLAGDGDRLSRSA